jgi:hypothetical protein
MDSMGIEPDSRLAKLCSYCSSLVRNLDGPLGRIDQGESSVTVQYSITDQDAFEFRLWVAAAENGCGMCRAFLNGLRSIDGEVISTPRAFLVDLQTIDGEISTSSSNFRKTISGKVKWTVSVLGLEHPNHFSRHPKDRNKIFTLRREIGTDYGTFSRKILMTEREASKH